MPDNYRRGFTSLVVNGSKIYSFGGILDDDAPPDAQSLLPCRDIMAFDTKTGCWIDDIPPHMPRQREHPAVMIFSGGTEVYVIGWSEKRVTKYDSRPFVFIYDLIANKWDFPNDEPSPKFEMDGTAKQAARFMKMNAYVKAIVMIVSSDTVFMHLPGPLNPPGSKSCIVVGNIMMVYAYPSLLAENLFSFCSYTWPRDRVSGDFEHHTSSATPDGHVFLFHSGGEEFYFLWSPKPDPYDDAPKAVVHCLRFLVFWDDHNECFSSHAFETTTYVTECAAGVLVDCVQM
ncbi:hypothetical protein AQUCO_00201419v1 [Aquilegia coerulea]|uniref:Uncharacterized protein n=1 Tax=Aquilegia coerulea TaxID=218851 RepID=A0A2G5F7Z1_AQUCA|nr:hypothetical protein AQUCO_00201419v1 [Aquilegia coerulea]